MHFDRPIYVIAGPTASGKSSLAIQLAKSINGVIINADSRQIYKELNIGTAKPTPDEILSEREWIIDGISHFLYGFLSVKESYNIYKYQKDVQNVLDSLPEDKTPILVGGTGLYIDSVVYNYKLKDDPGVRKIYDGLSTKELQSKLQPGVIERLNESDRNNPVRLVRLIEKGALEQERGKELDHRYFVVDRAPEELRKRIKQRVDKMFEEGLLEENEKIYKEGLFELPILQKTIGYQEFQKYFSKESLLEEVKERIIINTNRYAKRQRTWFRRNKDVMYIKNIEEILTAIS